jgi:hypothetical protein
MPRRIGEVKPPGLASQHQPFFHWQYIYIARKLYLKIKIKKRCFWRFSIVKNGEKNII